VRKLSNLIIDIREPKEIINKLKLNKKIPVVSQVIEIGDYLLPNGYAIERKHGRDLMSSTISNRLFEQLNALYEFEHPILAIISENVWKDFYFSRSKYIHKQYIGLLSTLSAKYPKLQVMFFDTDEMFIAYLESLYKKLTSDGSSERPQPRLRKAKRIEEVQENFLCSVKGISVKSSKKILKKFKTIENVCKATSEDIQKVDKINKKQSEDLYNVLHHEYHCRKKKKNNGK